MYKRFANKGKIIMSDSGGSYYAGKVKKQKTNFVMNTIEDSNHQHENAHSMSTNDDSIQLCDANNDRTKTNEPWIPKNIDSFEISVELPLPNLQNVQLTGTFNDTQAFVVEEKSLVIVKKVVFKDMSKYISGCSTCHNLNSDFLLYLEASSLYNSEDSSSLLLCEHVKAAISLLLHTLKIWKRHVTENQMQTILDEHCNWQTDTNFYISSHCNKFCGTLSPNDGIVLFELKNNIWKCASCKYQTASKCRHGQLLNSTEQFEDGSSLIAPESVSTGKIVQILSTERFSVDSMYDLFFERAVNIETYLKRQFHYDNAFPDILKIKPETEQCLTCGQNLKIIKKQHKGYILLSVVATCDVYVGECCNKECMEFESPVSFFGTSSGFVNYSNKFIIGVELIIEYMQLYAKNGLSFSAWIETKIVLSQSVTETKFYRNASYISSYFGVLHEVFCRATDLFIFPKETFYCCPSPKVIQMDGLVNSVKANRIPVFSEPWIKDTVTKRASKHNERQLERVDVPTQKLIVDIIQGKKCSDKTLEILRKSTNSGVKALSFCFERSNKENVLKESSILFAKTLTKSIAAANSLIPSTCESVVSSIINTWTISADELSILKRESPTLYGIYVSIISSNQNILQHGKEALINVFVELLNKRTYIYENNNETFTEPISEAEYEDLIRNTNESISAPCFELTELWKTGFFFPEYKVIRKISEIKIPGEQFPCSKNYQPRKTMGPGTIYFFCVEHQKCIGFIVLHKPESLRIITHTLLTRFEIMPEKILYDNGCNLNEYILNRYPNEFKDTRILVDGFHFNSHVNCSPSYDSSALPGITRSLNTSLLEQKNSRFSKMKSTSPFLKLETFMSKLRYTAMIINNASK